MLLNKRTIRITLCGMIASLCTTLMFITNIIPTLSYAIPAMSGMLIISIVIEINKKWAFYVFFCTSIICLFIISDKEATLIFIMFFGHYPILKALIESLKNKYLQLAVKLIIFNTISISEFYLLKYIFLIPPDLFSIGFINGETMLLIVSNLSFVAYDFSTSILIHQYILRVHPKLKCFINK